MRDLTGLAPTWRWKAGVRGWLLADAGTGADE